MPHELFNRVAEVYVGTTGGNTLLSVSALRVTFDIKKTMTVMPNTAKIEIYNLSELTRNGIQDAKATVLIRAGYANDEGAQDIFKGIAIRVAHERRPPDVVTTIEALDRVALAGSPRVTLGYPGGTSAKRILNDIVKQLGLSRKSTSVDVDDRTYKMGFSTVGSAVDSLSRVCAYLGLSWSMQNQEIKFTPMAGHDNSGVIKIAAATGMLNAPVYVMNVAPPMDIATVGKLDIKRTLAGGMQAMKPGWRVKSLLRSSIEPKNRVVIESLDKAASGTFTVETVQHNGDTAGGDWSTTLEVYQ